MSQGARYRDHICCGNGSSADFMVSLYNSTGKKEYLEKAKALMLSDREYAFLPDNHRNSFVAGFYFGASGVGYEILRILNPNFFPSALI